MVFIIDTAHTIIHHSKLFHFSNMSLSNIGCRISDRILLETPLVQLILRRKRAGKEEMIREILNGARIPIESIGFNIKSLFDLVCEIQRSGATEENQFKLQASREYLRLIINLLNDNRTVLRAFAGDGKTLHDVNDAIEDLFRVTEEFPSRRTYFLNFHKDIANFLDIMRGLYVCYDTTRKAFDMLSEALNAGHLMIGRSGFLTRSVLWNGLYYVGLENNDTGEQVLRAAVGGKFFARLRGEWSPVNGFGIPFCRPILFCVPDSPKARFDRMQLREHEERLEMHDQNIYGASVEGISDSFDSLSIVSTINKLT